MFVLFDLFFALDIFLCHLFIIFVESNDHIIVIVEMEVFLHSIGIFQIATTKNDSSRECQLIESKVALEQSIFRKKKYLNTAL